MRIVLRSRGISVPSVTRAYLQEFSGNFTQSLQAQNSCSEFALSQRTQLTRPNGVNTNYSYDNLSRLLSVLHQVGATTVDGASYTYDNAGNRIAKNNYLNGITDNYGYDNIYQLLQVAQGATTTESYTYDRVGNRLSSLGMSPYTYNTSNQLTSTPAATYTYDNNANTLTKADATGTTTYSWDYENRLKQATLPGTGGTVSFKYDPFGRRVQKVFNQGGTTTTTNYLYDGANILEEVDNSGNVLARYTQGPGIDQPLSELRGGSTSYYQQVALSTVTSLSNSAGALANTYTYDSYGKLTASTGTLVNPFQYTGREFDSETGIYEYRARFYDANTGRFLSENPIRFQGGVDFYRYALNAPINFKDPLGLTATCYYAQNTGHLVCYDDTSGQQIVNTYGYAGGDEGNAPQCVNNSGCQYQRNRGPLPWGDYTIGPANNRMGPLSLPLTPIPGTNTWGRSGFYIHGDNSCLCQSGSQGCIVVPRPARQAINDAGGGLIEVGPTDPDLSPGSMCTGGVCRL